MKLLLYCTKAKPNIVKGLDNDCYISDAWKSEGIDDYKLNGKIVAECDFEVEEIEKDYGTRHASFDKEGYFDDYYDYMTKTLDEDILLKRSCLNVEEIEKYNPNYAIHIKNLHISDKPRDIRNYYNIAPRTMADCMNQKALLKAPQNMCNAYDVYKNHYILISIRPEWLCKILNGEKTIEVRKKVLKEMLN